MYKKLWICILLETSFKVAFSLLFFYFIFALFPSAGPQFYFDLPKRTVPTNGYIFQDIMHAIQAGAEQPTGAFPSSHVGVTIAILILARKRLPLFFKICIPLSIILVLSTVFIKAHYAVDALFGLLIARDLNLIIQINNDHSDKVTLTLKLN